MRECLISAAARLDLSEIDAYSAEQFGNDAADAYARGFNKAFALLTEHPHAGAPTPEYGKAYRCLIHQKHRIFYRIEKDRVMIVRVLHHARDSKRAFREKRV